MKKFNFKFLILALLVFFFNAKIFSQSEDINEAEKAQLRKADSLWTINEFDKAILEYEKFLDSKPHEYARVRINLVKAYAYLGMFKAAEKRAKELYGIDSELRGENCRLGLIYTMQNRNDDALRAVNEMLSISDLNRVFPGSPTCAMFFQTKAGEYEDAANYIYKIIEEAPGEAKLQFMLYASYLEQQLGNPQKAKAILDQVTASVDQLEKNGTMDILLNQPGGSRYYVHLAELKLLEGKKEIALDYLQKAYENGDRYYYWIKNVSPFFEKIEDNSEFTAVLDDMKKDIDEMRENVEAQLVSE